MTAKAELEHTEAAFDKVRAALLEAIASSAFDEADKRERLYLSVQILDGARTALIAVASGESVDAYVKSLAEASHPG